MVCITFFGGEDNQSVRISHDYISQNYTNAGTGTLSRKVSYIEMQEKKWHDKQTWKFALKDLQAHITFKIEACQSV